jgi:hypothetical protein
MRRSWTGIITLAVFSLAFTINPGYFMGCTSELADDFDFGETEIEELLDETNRQEPWAFAAGGARYQLALRLQQQIGEDIVSSAVPAQNPLFASPARACGQRTFLQSAAACIPSTHVPLMVEVQLTRFGDFAEPAKVFEFTLPGQLTVFGRSLDSAFVEVAASGVRFDLLRAGGKAMKLAHFDMLAEGIRYSSL